MFSLKVDHTCTPKYIGEAHFMFILNKNVHLLGKSMVCADIKNTRNGQLEKALRYLTLYAPCIILQYVYESTRCTKFL